MQMDFIVLGLARSATTWLANWLTTDRSICLHDPLADMSVAALCQYRSPSATWGVSCTGLWLYPELLMQSSARILLVDRDVRQINKSLVGLGLPAMPEALVQRFRQVAGPRIAFEELWTEDGARRVWTHLLPNYHFDADRYRLLRSMSIQPKLDRYAPEPEVMKQLIERVASAMT
jgi:hypothetical protein